ncbi:MAG: hypothetical protein HKN79_09715 [Flavobacteriales bacterium]|nr:hypothetical protein [Flavobacteriales bacterium]
MQILKIRIVLDHTEEVFRDLELEYDGTMEQLHESILAAFDVENDQMASFYKSDEHWNKGEEIALVDMGASEEPVLLMSETAIKDCLEERSRMLYVYDFLNLRIFYMEVLSLSDADPALEYPRIAMALGELPPVDDPFDMDSLMEGIDLSESRDNVKVDDDPYADEDDMDAWDEGSGMENLDDYEGLI